MYDTILIVFLKMAFHLKILSKSFLSSSFAMPLKQARDQHMPLLEKHFLT